MIGPRHVHPDELGDAEGMDLQDAMRVANRLVESMDDVPLMTPEDFSDRVMSALADEPTPGTTGFLVPLRRRGVLGGLASSVRQAWGSVGSGRPMLGRTAALAYVLAVAIAGISLAGAATIGAAGALGLFNPAATESPAPTAPEPTTAPQTAPPSSIAPPPSPSPDISAPPVEPTPSPTGEDDGPDASDDHGGNSGPGGGGDDNSGPGGGDDDNSGPGGDDGSGSGGNSGPGSSGSRSDDSGPGSDDAGRR